MKNMLRLKVIQISCVVCLFTLISAFADVQWSRFNGKVKGINGKTSQLTIQNKEGDLFTVKVDADVIIVKGKEVVLMKDVRMDENVSLLYLPKAPDAMESDEPESGSVYLPIRR